MIDDSLFSTMVTMQTETSALHAQLHQEYSHGTFEQRNNGHLHGTHNGVGHIGGMHDGKFGSGPKHHNSMADSSESWRSPAYGSSKWQEPSWRSQNRGNWKNQNWRTTKPSSAWTTRDISDAMQNVSLIDHQQLPFGSGGGMRGSIPFGTSNAKHRYSTEVLAKIYRQLLYTGRLSLPSSVSRDDPMLFTTAGEFVDVVEQLQGVVNRPANAYISTAYSSTGAPKSTLSPMNSIPGVLPDTLIPGTGHEITYENSPAIGKSHVVEDTYMYIDPQGIWQGPFGRAEILGWHAAGFFPPDLVMKSSSDTTGRLFTLQEWLMTCSGSAFLPNQHVVCMQEHVVQHQNDHLMAQQPLDEVVIANTIAQNQSEDEIIAAESPLAPYNTAVEDIEPPQEIQAPARPETKPAPWIASTSIDEKVSLRDIQQEENERKSKMEHEAKIEAQKLSLQKSGWASVARSSDSQSLKDIQNEELYAKQESQNAFWDYSESKVAPVGISQESSSSAWIAAAASGASQLNPKTAAPVAKPKPAVVPRPSPPPPPPAAVSEPQHQTVTPDSPAFQIPEMQAAEEGHPLVGDFRAWCAEQMAVLTGSTDVTLCEFLMTVESNSEIADYVAAYLGTKPAAATFSTEFIKRKLVEMASGKKSRKARAKARAKAAAAAAAESKANTGLLQEQVSDSSWETVETSKRKGKSDLHSRRESVKNYSSGFAVLGS